MKLKIINRLLALLCYNLVLGQTHILVPNKGIEGTSIVIDSSKISDVIEIYGMDYTLSSNTFNTNYRYDSIGLTFQIEPYDKNQIVRSISAESPFKAKTENGIVLNESTMNNVWNTYNSQGCFTSKSYAHHTQNGISFYIKKDPNKKGYDPKEIIYKIETNNNDDFGLLSRVNFEFNDIPFQEKLNTLLSILQSETFDFKKLNNFWSKEKLNEKDPYGIIIQTVLNRKIENDFTQESYRLILVGSTYKLNIIRSKNKLAYLKLTELNEEKVIYERIENPQFEKIDIDIYTYGTICGSVGTPPTKCRRMLELVNANFYEQLAYWMKSINPEIATYGYIGIEFLKKKGIPIKETELERMKILRESEIQLNTCKGCTSGVTEKINEILTNDNLNKIYHSFKQIGLLK